MKIRPMLAHFYNGPTDFCYPIMWVQPKLDGIRCMVFNGTTLITRDGIVFADNRLLHIRKALSELDLTGLVLDGELYCHGMPLQKINARVRCNSTTPHDDESSLTYCCYDIGASAPFGFRYLNAMRELSFPGFKSNNPVVSVPTHATFSDAHVRHLHEHYRSNGYEGVMVRDPVSPYMQTDKVENRVGALRKLKSTLDAEGVVVETELGDDFFSDMVGTLHIRLDNGILCRAGGGLSHEQRRAYLNPDLIIGKRVRIEYERLSVGGLPLKPIINCVYE